MLDERARAEGDGMWWRRTAVLLFGAVGAAASATAMRSWQRRWSASGEELETALRGDDLIAEPAVQQTRAITIDAPAERVWPWIVQLGADRAGFYSYDWLENLFGLGIHSADEIVPAWQVRAVGDLVAADHRGRGGWYVTVVRPGETLALQMANPNEGRPARRDDVPGWEFLWTFALRRLDADHTRLLVRERVAFGNRLMRWSMAPVGWVSFVMTRKMMLGIKQRAESAMSRRETAS
jgi:hypothetical protein